MITDYFVCYGHKFTEELRKNVKVAMEKGWQPFGAHLSL